MLTFDQARRVIIRELGLLADPTSVRCEIVSLSDSLGRTVAQEIRADRQYPPFDRSIRDGYAVRAVNTHSGATLACIGELKAGDTPSIAVPPGACIQIMTGAALPEGADAVIMIARAGQRAACNRHPGEPDRPSLVKSPGAGEGNRTLVFSLEGCCSTIELHPRLRDHLTCHAGGLNCPALASPCSISIIGHSGP